jgi:hypothetical protein
MLFPLWYNATLVNGTYEPAPDGLRKHGQSFQLFLSCAI